jgi:hypothetical protein
VIKKYLIQRMFLDTASGEYMASRFPKDFQWFDTQDQCYAYDCWVRAYERIDGIAHWIIEFDDDGGHYTGGLYEVDFRPWWIPGWKDGSVK